MKKRRSNEAADHEAVPITVENALQRARDSAALLRYAADLAAASPEQRPEPEVPSGLADLCGDIAETVQSVWNALDEDALCAELGTRARR